MNPLVEYSALEHVCKNQTAWVPNSAVPLTNHVTYSFTFVCLIFPSCNMGTIIIVPPRLIVKMKWVNIHKVPKIVSST